MNYLFSGQESHLKEKAIESLKSKLLKKDSFKLNFSIYQAGIDDIKDILDTAKTLPLSGEFRIIVIKNIDKLLSRDRERLLDYLKKPSTQTALILDCSNDIDKDDSWINLMRLAKRVHFKKPVGRDLDIWVKNEASRLDKSISNEAIELLKEKTEADDLNRLKNELGKLSLFVGENAEINESDVEEIVGKSSNKSIFKLIDYISQKDAESSLDIISDLISRKVKPYEIIGLLAWYFRNIFMNNSKYPSFNKDKIKDNIELLLNADLAIKRSKMSPKLVLEFAVLRLCR